MLILNDNQFFEGIVGGLGFIVSMFYIKRQLKDQNVLITSIVCWSILWIIRKISMNFYVKMKDHYKKSFPGFEINVSDKNVPLFIISSVVLTALFFYVTVIHKAPLKIVDKLLARPDRIKSVFPLVVMLAILGFIVYTNPFANLKFNLFNLFKKKKEEFGGSRYVLSEQRCKCADCTCGVNCTCGEECECLKGSKFE